MQTLFVIFPLITTLLLETGIYMILKHRDLKLFFVVSIMNLVLNPTMNFILIIFGKNHLSYWLILGIGEVLTTLIESLIVFLFMRFKYLKILLFAVIANAVSFLIGLALDPVYDYQTVLIVLMIVFAFGYLATYFVVFWSYLKKNSAIES